MNWNICNPFIAMKIRNSIIKHKRLPIPFYFIPGMLIFFSCSKSELPDRIIRYDQPADYFEEALPLGNGRIGAMVYGGTDTERIVLNEETVWTGGPVDPYMNREAYKHLPAVREALFNENYRLADSLVRNLQGKFSESYAPPGDLYIDFLHEDSISDYYRGLDLRTGIATVYYSSGEVDYFRELFTSFPDKVLVIRLTASKRKELNLGFRFSSQLRHTVYYENDRLIMRGQVPVHCEPNYRNLPDAIVYDGQRSMRFEVQAAIVDSDGSITGTDSSCYLRDASKATILVSIATSFNGYDKEPGLDGLDESVLASGYLTGAMSKSHSRLRKEHVADFSGFFNRVVLDLGPPPEKSISTDARLIRYSEGNPDNDLEALYFQFGRYLMISSSRPGGIPTNLQGIWNPHMRPPWSSNFTTNINAEMNYWPAEVCNLSELHEPLLHFIQKLSTTGEITARTFYDCGGWCCSHNSDIWAMTNPVGDFGQGHPVWANWSMAGPWYSTHLWEHFLFTRDTLFLKDYAYPLMKGAARFCMDYLTEGPDGYLVSAPSTSPENMYLTPDNYRGATLYGSTADMAMIRQHLLNTVSASEALGVDADFQQKLQGVLAQLYPYQVGSRGNLQEWYHDWEDADPHHRHVSHLFGLHPGNSISPLTTPELAEACKQTLLLRGDGGTGWSKAWKINLWARLLDGNHAHRMLNTHLNYVSPDPETQDHGGGTYPNLWDAHPPFQIDGNFGGTAGIAEMLLQSHHGEIHLLPALPDAWPNGSIRGLRARGGYTVDMCWSDGKLTEAKIKTDCSGDVIVRYDNSVTTHQAKKGKIVAIRQ